MELEKLFNGISERYENLFLFKPVFDLNNGKKEKYADLDLMEIGFSVLLFIIEKMLTDRGNVTYEQLNRFLNQLLDEAYNQSYTYEEVDELRRYIVDEKLRNNGNDFIYEYMDFRKKEKQYVKFKLIEYDKWTYSDHMKKEVKLSLTDKGIEFLFKTKEYYAEMQISITMLYFKQQLEKGAYSQVLQIAKELIFQIDTQVRSIESYEEKIKRNVLSAFSQKEMEERLQRSYEQTKSERKQISDLRENTDRVKLNYINGKLTQKERENYETVLEIDGLLNRAITKHNILYGHKLDLIRTLGTSIQKLIENAFSKRFNFEQEIVENWIERKITQEKIHQILKPVSPLKRPTIYNPLRAFSPQQLRKKNNEVVEELEELDENELKEQTLLQRMHELKENDEDKKIMKMILDPLAEKESYFISDVFKPFRKSNIQEYSEFEEEYLERILEISVALHQTPYKKFELISEEDLVWDTRETKLLCEIAKENPTLLDIKEFEIYESERTYKFLTDETTITDYIILRKEDGDAL